MFGAEVMHDILNSDSAIRVSRDILIFEDFLYISAVCHFQNYQQNSNKSPNSKDKKSVITVDQTYAHKIAATVLTDRLFRVN